MRWPGAREGQATVELAVVAPVAIVVGLVVVNLAIFLVRCARFDRVAADMVVAHGSAPQGTQDTMTAASQIEQAIEDAMGCDDVEVTVNIERLDPVQEGIVALSPTRVRVRCSMGWRPFRTLVSVAGVPMGAPLVLSHERSVVLDMGSVGMG